jgi:hypothetical protein
VAGEGALHDLPATGRNVETIGDVNARQDRDPVADLVVAVDGSPYGVRLQPDLARLQRAIESAQ